MSRRIVVCLECGAEGPHSGRGLCSRCYSWRQRAGTLAEFPPLKRLGVAARGACRNGHQITTEGDLAPNRQGGVTCRECRRETHARHDLKRGRSRTTYPCPRCGVDCPVAGLCRDCRRAAS